MSAPASSRRSSSAIGSAVPSWPARRRTTATSIRALSRGPERLTGHPHVVDGVGVAREGLPDQHPGEVDPSGQRRLVHARGGLDRPVEQRRGVGRRETPRGLLTRGQPRARGPAPVAEHLRVPGERLRAVGQQLDRAAVVGDPGRLRRGRVQHLVQEVVGELVARAGRDQQPGHRSLLAQPDRLRGGHIEHPGDEVRLHRRPRARRPHAAPAAYSASSCWSRLDTAPCSDSGTPASPAASARSDSTTNKRVPRVRRRTSSACRETPARAASRLTAAAGSTSTSSRAATSASAASAAAPSSLRTVARISSRAPAARRTT